MYKVIILISIIMASAATISAQQISNRPQVLLDHFIQEEWSQTETNNAKIVIDFVQKLMNDHDFDYIEQTYGSHPYVQHNRSMTDGIPGVLGAVKGIVKGNPDYCYDVKRILVSGDYVVFHSHITIKAKDRGNEKKGLVISDTWRVKEGKIVEHWDAIQPLQGLFRFMSWLNGGKIRNSNGLF